MCNLLVYYKITQKSTPGETPGFSSTMCIRNRFVTHIANRSEMFQMSHILLKLNTERQYARHGAGAPPPNTAHTPDRYCDTKSYK